MHLIESWIIVVEAEQQLTQVEPRFDSVAIGFGIGNSAVNQYTVAACSADLCLALRKTRRLASTMGDLPYDRAEP
jgi:hypothetical protein